KDSFGSLLAAGITSLIVFQALVNISVVTKLIPTTGITLPFISYGGSSLILNMFCCGILLNISKNISIPDEVL
ncbi:MAG: FtsW/RodA/SpoVE family cell cycle protein, partial [Candidatus Atribacteria bacterium]|nr:FtsW/RodA/SpoVE family cell cycle protein [Candidatus Atribacteria bacterium]